MIGIVANLEMSGSNPMLPMTYDLIWSGFLLFSLVVIIALVVDIIRLPATVTETVALILLVLLAPVVGWVIYFVLRPRIAVRRKTQGDPVQEKSARG
ncbi:MULTISPECIES: hypothetical protein [unclassified Corynebacterium]|uniref:hypothetical protein n=1 Tax=unclassified Corynebacterium TaxID=2624378 RepID=UPI0029C9F413|nr:MULTISPECIES: hypothetical protein [unclassified Corynebacterium]WPF66059.1 hypothetical protein OLX12_10995 [Corynebacterium sp. 22KM0430]WPF68551.1 hypothetical protein OLW90_10990 [Corynebacterium sp. 21KM1197]